VYQEVVVSSDPERHPIVIDTDPGIDDVVALSLAARSAKLDILAVTTSYGNAPLHMTSRNAVEVLRLAGRSDVTVLPGSASPLKRPLVTAPETHGETGVGHALVPDSTPTDVQQNSLVLIDVLSAVSCPLTLVTLGPLTNLAHALETDTPLVKARVVQHIGTFGTVGERGNANRWADFNAWCDPEATDLVLRAGLNTLMVGLDVTRRMTLSAAEVWELTTSQNTLINWLGKALQFYVEVYRCRARLDGCVLNDILPVGELIAPGLLTSDTLLMSVDLDEGEHRGHTRAQPTGTSTRVASDVDVNLLRGTLDALFGDGWSAQKR
jgi:inosine-uridine nucleoside N-ribohydrolase